MATATKTTQAFDKLNFRFKPKEPLLDDKFCKKAASLREDGKSWNEIAEELDSKPATVSLAARVHEFGRIPFRNEGELVTKVAKARDKDAQPWAVIGARVGGMSEARVQSLYEEATGNSYLQADIGKGGRPKENTDDKPKPKAKPKAKAKSKTKGEGKTKKPAAKKATKKAASKKGKAPNFGDEPTLESVAKALEGNTITVKKGSGTAEMTVTEVQAVKQNKKGDWGAKVTTDDGAERTFALANVQKVA